MAAELAVDRFLSLLGRSGLLAEEQMQPLLEEFGEPSSEFNDSGKIAKELVSRKVLTSWQADMLLQGKHRGFVLGPYRILKPLGKGGMGAVFLAEHQRMRRRCAIKVLPSEHAKGDSSILDRFYREAQAVAALDHPNIVRAYDVNVAVQNNKEIHYLVMEYVEGQDLQKRVGEQGVLGYREAAEWIRQAAEGLAHAHESGLVHRDIKPANLLVDSKGVVKVLDLGLARFFSDAAEASLTKEMGDTVLGTADYLAPEQAMDSHNVDERADIYSLGQTFYFLLTGRPPFPKGTVAQRLMAHQMKAPEPISKRRPDAPLGLLAIIDKMIAKDPSERYQTAKEVAEALAGWRQEYSEGSGFLRRSSRLPGDSGSAITLRREPTQPTSDHAVDTDLELAPMDDDELKPPSSRTKLPSVKSDSQAGGSRDRLAASQSDALAAPHDSTASAPPDDSESDDSQEEEEYGLSGELDDLPPLEPQSMPEFQEGDPLSAPIPAQAPLRSPTPTPGKAQGKRGARDRDRSVVAMVLDSGFFWIGIAVTVVLGLIIAFVVSRPPSRDEPQPGATPPPDSASPAEPDSPAEKLEKTNAEKPAPREAGSEPTPPESPKPKQPRRGQRRKQTGTAGAPPKGTGRAASPSPPPAEAEPPGQKDTSGSGAAVEPKPPTEQKATPPQKPPEQAGPPPKPPTDSKPKSVDLQALFARVSRVSIQLESADPNPNSKLNLTIRHAAQRWLERIGASPSRDDAAVMHLRLEATPANQLVQLVLAGELTCRVSESDTVEVWEDRREIARLAPSVLRGRTVHPTLREGVSDFFDALFEAHRKACQAVDSKGPTSK